MTIMRALRPTDFRSADHRTISQQHMDWGPIHADIVKRTGLKRQETRLAPDQHAVLFNLKGEARLGEDFVEGQRVSFTPRRPGSIVFVPAKSEWKGWDEGDTTGSYLYVSIERSFVEDAFGSDPISGLKPVIGLRDTMIESSLQTIAGELVSPDHLSFLIVESLAIQLFVQLLRLNALGQETAKGGLSSFDLRRVLAMIDDQLAEPPSLDRLAREIGLSRRHFFRAFKQSTGKSPYAYVMDHRLERATNLLRDTEMSATAIALESGFASSSHFTATFRRRFRVSPLEFRRNWRS